MRRKFVSVLVVSGILMTFDAVAAQDSHVRQIEIPAVENMPDMPHPYKMKDWKSIAVKQDRLLYDFSAKGHLYPLCWWDNSNYNFDGTSFGIVSYVGQIRNTKADYVYESLPVMGSIIGATFAGIDKSNQNGTDFVSMIRQFYTRRSGLNLIMNSPNRARTGSSFWYEIFPGMAFSMICDLYPDNEELSALMLSSAHKWIQAIKDLSKGKEYPDFNCTSYDYRTREAFSNGRWREPDAAAGLAWMEYAAYVRSGKKQYLDAALECIEFLQERPASEGPYYEIMMPYGAYLAVRLNAENGLDYDEMKMLSWCFDGHNSDRDGWGVMTESWNGLDVSGLVGQKKYEHYAFAMNTFSQLAALVPIVKYNPSYSHTIAKYVLNAANASRFFYADEHPARKQTSWLWKGDPDHVICYEGFRSDLKGNHFEPFIGILDDEGPYACGDHVKNFISYTDICPYGSAWSGILAGLLRETDIEGILQIDCNATDYFGDRTFEHYLVLNPYNEIKKVNIVLPEYAVDVYDIITGRYIAKDVKGIMTLEMYAGQTYNIVCIPSGTALKRHKGTRMTAGDRIIVY